MGDSPKITIVTVAYNAAGTIADTIRSVAAQDYAHVEHIVIDGASSDGTLEIVQKTEGRVSRLVSQPDRGIYDAMNKGIAMATGDVIGFLNADDIYAHKGVLARVAAVFAENMVDACYGDLVYVDREDIRRAVRYWKSKPYEPGLCLKGWMPAHPTFFVRRQIYIDNGGFDIEFRRQADFDLALRLFEVHRINAKYIPEILVRMRAGGLSNNSIRGVVEGNLEAYRACRKHGFNVTPFFMVRKISSRVPQFFRSRISV